MTGIGTGMGRGVTRPSRVAKKAKRPPGSAKPPKGPINIGGGPIVKSPDSSKPKPSKKKTK
jgi:hypothetical protein